jgi:hypothetical protein
MTMRAAAFLGRELKGSVSSITPLVEPGRIEPSGTRNQTDLDVVQVMVELRAGQPAASARRA